MFLITIVLTDRFTKFKFKKYFEFYIAIIFSIIIINLFAVVRFLDKLNETEEKKRKIEDENKTAGDKAIYQMLEIQFVINDIIKNGVHNNKKPLEKIFDFLNNPNSVKYDKKSCTTEEKIHEYRLKKLNITEQEYKILNRYKDLKQIITEKNYENAPIYKICKNIESKECWGVFFLYYSQELKNFPNNLNGRLTTEQQEEEEKNKKKIKEYEENYQSQVENSKERNKQRRLEKLYKVSDTVKNKLKN